MHLFITGGSGLTGPAVVAELISAGHRVTGLARSDASAERLRGLGAEPVLGALEDHDRLTEAASASEGVIHMAFGGSFADPDDLVRRDVTAIEALGRGLVDTGKPLIMTSGTFAMAAGRVSTEQDAADDRSLAWFRIPGERACLSFAERGVRSIVMRLSPTVHGPGDYGFIPMLIAAARRNGVSAYVGDGANRWPTVHRLDVATLYRLAAEKAPAGSALHGAAESAVTLQTIAHRIGRHLGLPTVSLTGDEAAAHFGDAFMATAFATDAPASSASTRRLLGWQPTHPTLLDDLEDGDYFSAETDLTRGVH
jgi:nucleoside-diphosphate-sugar epimerase